MKYKDQINDVKLGDVAAGRGANLKIMLAGIIIEVIDRKKMPCVMLAFPERYLDETFEQPEETGPSAKPGGGLFPLCAYVFKRGALRWLFGIGIDYVMLEELIFIGRNDE